MSNTTDLARPRGAVRRFNRDEKSSIAHALTHLKANHIADKDYSGNGGWYLGNREQFVKRHEKAIALLESLLAPSATKQALTR